MLETMKYVRKPFYIDAVQISAQNITEVARWVDGEVRSDKHGQYVKVRVHHPMNDRQTKAYIGDWVLYAGTSYKVYTPKAFTNSFEQVSTEVSMVDTTPTSEPVMHHGNAIEVVRTEQPSKKIRKDIPA